MLQLAPHVQAGQRLKGAMRARGWPLADLARATGLSVRTCCTLQQGQGNVGNYTRCCIALGVPTGLANGNPSGRHLRLAKWDDRGSVCIECDDTFVRQRQIPDKCIRFTFTSPPYPDQKVYTDEPGENEYGNSTLEEYDADTRKWLRELYRITTDDGSAWIAIGYKRDKKGRLVDVPALVAKAAHDVGWHVKSRITWSKGNRGMDSATNRPRDTDEVVLFLTKRERGYYYNKAAARQEYADGGRHADPEKEKAKVLRSTLYTDAEKDKMRTEIDRLAAEGRDTHIRLLRGGKKAIARGTTGNRDQRDRATDRGWQFDRRNRNPLGAMGGNRWCITQKPSDSDPLHPCTTPVEVSDKAISTGCPPGATVFDPFAGVGSTALSALKHGHPFWGIEKEQKFISRAWVRILQSETASG